ncbi:DedA family protein [Cohnella thermotolerans]|uniref:DedA family protein n=1 Tax=Cohnella thermotolerans TaxID=329858 RepID=UPI000405C606|nr:DedA family protein [Cohnella thermotolerans]
MSITDQLLELVFRYQYIGLFGAMSLGIVGLPVPDEVLLTAAGYLMSRGSMHLGWTMLAAVSGSVVGMSASYTLGRVIGLRLLEKYGRRIGFSPSRLERHEKLFAKWGQAIILIGYFVPGLRHATAVLAGVGRRPYRSFALYAAIGALLWTSVFELIGVLLGEHWREVTAIVHRNFVYLIAGAALLSVTALLWRWRVGVRS